MTFVTAGHTQILQSEGMAFLLIDVVKENRKKGRFLLHEFVVMPDHFHLLITPAQGVSLEKAVQYIKGGFSFRARKEHSFQRRIWQESFTNHRIRDAYDYEQHRAYIRENPTRKFLVQRAELFPYSSAYPNAVIDPAPPWLKPSS